MFKISRNVFIATFFIQCVLSQTNILNENGILNENSQLTSLNGQYKALLQNDGNFVIYVSQHIKSIPPLQIN